MLGFKGTKKVNYLEGEAPPSEDMKVPTTLSGGRFRGGRPRGDPREPDSLFSLYVKQSQYLSQIGIKSNTLVKP